MIGNSASGGPPLADETGPGRPDPEPWAFHRAVVIVGGAPVGGMFDAVVPAHPEDASFSVREDAVPEALRAHLTPGTCFFAEVTLAAPARDTAFRDFELASEPRADTAAALAP